MSKASAISMSHSLLPWRTSDIFAYQLHKEAKTIRPPSPHHPRQLPHPSNSAPLMASLPTGGQRKKSSKGTTGIRSWLLMDSGGKTQVVEAGKHVIMRRTGLPARDLRILDPVLMYPSTVLGRERAIVINLEHIKAIVTAHEVLLVKSAHPSVSPFVDELQLRLIRHNQVTTAALVGTMWSFLLFLERFWWIRVLLVIACVVFVKMCRRGMKKMGRSQTGPGCMIWESHSR